MPKKKTIEDQYKKLNQREHVLVRPDTYVGVITPQKEEMWIYSNKDNKMIKKEIRYVPGLYKIFDEILVNARDQTVVDSECNTIKVWINQEEGEITVWNNGKGIPVVIHKEHNIYIPHLLFANLLSGTNFDDEEDKTTGGRNGLGAKLCNIFSTEFTVETVDKERKMKFVQTCKNNMLDIGTPKVTKLKSKSPKGYTKITFKPDLEKFGIKKLSNDTIGLFEKRVYDIAACTGNKVKVFLNDTKVEINTFKKYIGMFYDEASVIYEEPDKRWKVGVIYIPDNGYETISYVNGISTYRGGSHVNYIVNNIIKRLGTFIKKKNKEVKVKASQIKENIVVFVDSVIVNPAFTSQTKEELKTKVSSFGSSCEVSDKFVKKISTTGILDLAIQVAELKQHTILKKTDGKKTGSVRGIPKLEDANWAGTKKSHLCKLILTEGDSAKALAMAGRDVVGCDQYGVFPLRGKLLNVREASPKKLLENAEIANIKKILGLKQGKQYTSIKELRYGGIIVLTDQDVDGFHIKGLLFNFFHFFWPSIIDLNEFIYSLATPIVKATKGKICYTFYNLTDYYTWKKDNNGTKGWKIKYYKGLGTSTSKEAKEYFTDIDDKLIRYVTNSFFENQEVDDEDDDEDEYEDEYEDEDDVDDTVTSKSSNFIINDEDGCTDSIELAFLKEKSNLRKDWLRGYDRNQIIDNDQKVVTYSEFVHKELIHFSNEDNIRSIPSLVDGMKPSTRKIYYGTVLRKLFSANDEIKVSQLVGFISDKTCYHHGEQSLAGAIVNMAQDFVGSNNINLLYPSGQFGTRLLGGKDHASPRYIFTFLEPIARYIFRPEDEPILNYLDDDGTLVEPEYYIPIIPMILINGTSGIGTGFSTDVPCYNPLDTVDNLRRLMKGKKMEEMLPWYRGFKGSVIPTGKNKYNTHGIYNIVDDETIEVTELPIGVWTTPYKGYLESLLESKNIKALADNNSDRRVQFTIKMNTNKLNLYIQNGTLDKRLKSTKPIGTTNMHLFNHKGEIIKYSSALDIIQEFYNIRLQAYKDRREYQIGKFNNELDILKWKMKFIKFVLAEKIVVFKRKRSAVIKDIEKHKFPKLVTKFGAGNAPSYDYITTMQLFSLTKDKIDELQKKIDEKEEELAEIMGKTEIDIWTEELDEFVDVYNEWIKEKEELYKEEEKKKKKGKGKKKKGKGKGKKKKA